MFPRSTPQTLTGKWHASWTADVGGRAGDTVEVRARRLVPRTQFLKGVQVTDTIAVESWARFVSTRGEVDPAAAKPIAGTWREADAMALFWSMREVPHDSLLRRVRTSNVVALTLEQNGVVCDSGTLTLRSSLDSLDERVILGGNFAGAFVVRRGARAAPVVMALHGSEGGDTVAAVALARRFAAWIRGVCGELRTVSMERGVVGRAHGDRQHSRGNARARPCVARTATCGRYESHCALGRLKGRGVRAGGVSALRLGARNHGVCAE